METWQLIPAVAEWLDPEGLTRFNFISILYATFFKRKDS